MHWVWETLPMLCLIHRWTSTTTAHSTNTSNSTDSSYRSLLDTTCLGTHHIYLSIVCTSRVKSNWGVAFIRATMINSFLSLMLRMMTAWCHWYLMLGWYMEMIILITLAGGSSTIYTIARGTSCNYYILAILEWSCRISAHYIT